jgi:hypothetical protein
MSDTDSRTVGLFWWRRSALVALGVTAIEWVAALTVNGIEFAATATPFVVVAFAAALVLDPLFIFFWVRSRSQIPALRNRIALPVFGALLCAPLLLHPQSAYEVALGAPTVLGFLLPGIMDARTR